MSKINQIKTSRLLIRQFPYPLSTTLVAMPIPFFGKQQQDTAQEQQHTQQQQSVEKPEHHLPQVDRFETTLKDELKLQELQYPTPDDVPACMRLLYVIFLYLRYSLFADERDDQG